MQEIEVKILGIDKEKIIQKMLHFGAEFVGEFNIHDKQFDYPDKRIRNSDELLRLRLTNNNARLTYKEQKRFWNGLRISEEVETAVADYKVVEAILNKLGLSAYCSRKKIRTSFKKGNIKFEIDEYTSIPPYLEIEGKKKEDILHAVNLLGYTMDDTTVMTATEVLRHYGIDQFI